MGRGARWAALLLGDIHKARLPSRSHTVALSQHGVTRGSEDTIIDVLTKSLQTGTKTPIPCAKRTLHGTHHFPKARVGVLLLDSGAVGLRVEEECRKGTLRLVGVLHTKHTESQSSVQSSSPGGNHLALFRPSCLGRRTSLKCLPSTFWCAFPSSEPPLLPPLRRRLPRHCSNQP